MGPLVEPPEQTTADRSSFLLVDRKLTPSAIVGGGVADANSHKGKHKDKNGKWHDYAAAVEPKEERLSFVRVGVPADRSQEVDMPWDYRVQDVTAPE